MEDASGDQATPKGNSRESDQEGDVHAETQEHDVDKTLYDAEEFLSNFAGLREENEHLKAANHQLELQLEKARQDLQELSIEKDTLENQILQEREQNKEILWKLRADFQKVQEERLQWKEKYLDSCMQSSCQPTGLSESPSGGASHGKSLSLKRKQSQSTMVQDTDSFYSNLSTAFGLSDHEQQPVQLDDPSLNILPPVDAWDCKSEQQSVVSGELLYISSEQLWQCLRARDGEVYLDNTCAIDDPMIVDANDVILTLNQKPSEQLWQRLIAGDDGEVHLDNTYLADDSMTVDANGILLNYDQNDTLVYTLEHIENNESLSSKDDVEGDDPTNFRFDAEVISEIVVDNSILEVDATGCSILHTRETNNQYTRRIKKKYQNVSPVVIVEDVQLVQPSLIKKKVSRKHPAIKTNKLYTKLKRKYSNVSLSVVIDDFRLVQPSLLKKKEKSIHRRRERNRLGAKLNKKYPNISPYVLIDDVSSVQHSLIPPAVVIEDISLVQPSLLKKKESSPSHIKKEEGSMHLSNKTVNLCPTVVIEDVSLVQPSLLKKKESSPSHIKKEGGMHLSTKTVNLCPTVVIEDVSLAQPSLLKKKESSPLHIKKEEDSMHLLRKPVKLCTDIKNRYDIIPCVSGKDDSFGERSHLSKLQLRGIPRKDYLKIHRGDY